jgi:glycosyltransferase involved in cell wall biosynthesis
VDWYLPGYKAGGPIRSVANLVKRLDLEFSIVTSDRDHGSEEAYPDMPLNKWVHGVYNERVMYLTADQQKRKVYSRILKEDNYDVIYLNSLFSKNFTLQPLRAIKRSGQNQKVLLAPRGMLKKGALSIKKNKKRLFLATARKMGLFKNLIWHATNEAEKKEVELHFPGAHIRVAPNLVAGKSQPHFSPNKTPGELKLVTIARVSKEKNILGALDYVLESNPALGNIQWDIYGAFENEEYYERCKELATQARHATIRFMGEIPHQEIPETLKNYHFFYLPTLGENFGHSIVEAWLTSTPVIISDRTPWHGLEDQRCGWELPLERHLFSEIINHSIRLPQSDYEEWSKGAHAKGKSVIMNKSYVRENYDLFLQ